MRNRRNLGARGGRPPKFDKADYRERHAVACGMTAPAGLRQGETWCRSSRQGI